MGDPYGGLPRHEDEDVDTAMSVAAFCSRSASQFDVVPTYMSFRDIVLSMQSLNAKHPKASETSVKRWARRAITRLPATATAAPPEQGDAEEPQPRREVEKKEQRAKQVRVFSVETAPILPIRSLLHSSPHQCTATVPRQQQQQPHSPSFPPPLPLPLSGSWGKVATPMESSPRWSSSHNGISYSACLSTDSSTAEGTATPSLVKVNRGGSSSASGSSLTTVFSNQGNRDELHR